jgi:hypothetical protein
MPRHPRYCLAAMLTLVFASTASGQRSHAQSPSPAMVSREAARLGAAFTPVARSHAAMQQTGGEAPRWVKWGLVGAAAGGVLFSVAGQSNPDGDRSVIGDAALGAAIGFVILGGAIALYDSVCAPASGSRRAGLCG